jgi:hypothetical protein
LRGQTSSSSWDMDARQPQLARIVQRYGLVPSLDIEA